MSLPSAKWDSDLSICTDANFWTQVYKKHLSHNQDKNYFAWVFPQIFVPTALKLPGHPYAPWHCTPIKQFWEKVTGLLSTFFGCCIPTSPSFCLLGVTTATTLNHITLLVVLAVSQKTILMNWKSKKKLCLHMYLEKLVGPHIIKNLK